MPKFAAKRDIVGRGTDCGDHHFVRKPRSCLRAKSGEFREQGARPAVIDAAAHARGDRRHRHGLALVYGSRFDRGTGHGDHRDRHCLFGGFHRRHHRGLMR